MKSAIFVTDDFSDFDRTQKRAFNIGQGEDFWFEMGRKSLHDYAKRFDLPVINTVKTSRFFKKFDNFCRDNDKVKFHTPYALKMMRWYEFIESDYDYAFFCDLDFLVTNPDVDVQDLVEEDTLYINAYNHKRDREIVEHKFLNHTSARYKLIKHYNPSLPDNKILNLSTGFHCIGKQSAIDIIKTLDRLGCNPMTEEGIDNMVNIQFPGCLDETMMAIAMNSMEIKYEFANIAKLCDEQQFYHEDEPSVFYHVLGRDRAWTKDRVFKHLDHFVNYFTRKKHD